MNRAIDITIVILFIAVVYLLGTRDWGNDAVVEESPSPSIAVLPFANLTGDAGNEYFSDGLSDEILNLLGKIPGLKVIARTPSSPYKGTNEDARTVGAALGASFVLGGAIRKEGAGVRVWVQLIRVADGFHLWSETYERTGNAVKSIPVEIASAIPSVIG